MAFSLYASVGSTTTQLNDGSPFRLESAEGLSGADIVRHEQRGPLQSSSTDLGFRLRPRVMTLNLLFHAQTDTLLDTYRSQLMAAFKPLDDISVFLSAQRDDGEIRTLVCHAVGDITIDLVPEHRPGHLHRATVKLRAANPLWKANSVTSQSYDYSALSQWWLAGGAISASQVKEHVEYPLNTATWSLGSAETGDWAVAIVTADVGGTLNNHAWDDSGSAGLFRQSGTTLFTYNNVTNRTWPSGTAESFHLIENRSNSIWWYWNGTAVTTNGNTGGDTNLASTGSWRRQWGGGVATTWSPEMPKAMIMNGQTDAQITALARYMLGQVQGSVSIVNDGDINAYPLITLHGPMVDPVITNTTTGGSINLTGLTLGSTDYYIIDLRNGNKSIMDQAGTNQLDDVTTPVSLANFYMAPAPVVSGGTNVVVVTPGSVGSASYFTVEITNQYMSY